MAKKGSNDFQKTLYGLFFGGLTAAIYLFVKHRTHDGGVTLFFCLSFVISALHLAFWPSSVGKALFNVKMFSRGVFYGLSQVCILIAQKNGDTATAIVSSMMGCVFGILLGRLFLKEKVRGLSLAGLFLCICASLLNPTLVLKSYMGLLGGFSQGVGFVLARFLMVRGESMKQAIASGFFASAITSSVYLVASSSLSSVLKISLPDLLFVVIAATIIQYGFFLLIKMFDTQKASILLSSRLPWAMALDRILFSKQFLGPQIIAAALALAANTLLLLDSKKKSK